MAATHGSPPGSNNTSPGRESSEDSDDSLPLAQLALKRSAEANQQTVPPVSVVTGASAAKKAKTTSKKKKKKDPNEPQKPVSAYALFFRDTQAAIKGQNPNASFGEVSKIVASMWDSLDEEQKNVYKKKTEVAKKEYLKQLAAYRASLVSKQGAAEAAEQAASQPKPIMPSPMGAGPAHPMQPLQEGMPPYMSPHHMGSMEMMGAHQMPPPNAPNPAEQHHHQMPNSPPQAMPMSPQMMQMNEQHMQVMSPDGSMSSPGPPMCVRPGCQNAPIEHPSWDQEFCSSGCVVDHCRDVFTAWVASRQNSYASVK